MAGRKGSDGDMVLGGGHLVAIFAFLVVLLGVVFSLGYVLGRSQFDAQLNPSVEAAVRRVDGLMGKPDKPGLAPEREVRERPAAERTEPTVTKAPKDDVDFYRAGQSKAPERLEPPAKPVVSKPRAIAAQTAKPSETRTNAAAVPAVAQPKSELVPAKAEVPSTVEVPAKAVAPGKPTAAPVVPAKPAKSGGTFRPGVPLNTPPIPAGATVLQVAALNGEGDALAMAQALQQKGFPAFVLTPANDQFYRVQVGPYADAKAASNARQGLEKQGFKSIIKR
jgi:cell division septation protein DedD